MYALINIAARYFLCNVSDDIGILSERAESIYDVADFNGNILKWRISDQPKYWFFDV